MEGEQFIKIEEEEGLQCVPLHCSQNYMLHFYNDDSDQPQAYDMKEHSITENGETPQHFIHSVPSALEYLSLHFDLRTMPLNDILAFAQLDHGFAHFDEWTELKRALLRQKNYLKREHAKKRNMQPNGLNPYFQPDESINTDLKVHLQTQNKKKRNRLSAQISRDRKKQMLQQLEKNHDQMRKQVQQLRVQNQSLKKQLYLHKQENKGRKNKPTFLTLLVFLGIIYLFGMLRQCSEVLKPKKKTDVILSTREQDQIYDQTESLIGSVDVFNNGIKNGMKALIRSQRSTLMPLSLPAKLGKQIVKLS